MQTPSKKSDYLQGLVSYQSTSHSTHAKQSRLKNTSLALHRQYRRALEQLRSKAQPRQHSLSSKDAEALLQRLKSR